MTHETIDEAVDAYNKGKSIQDKVMMLARAETAIAWGHPDRYSVGYTPKDLTIVIQELVNYIKENCPTS